MSNFNIYDKSSKTPEQLWTDFINGDMTSFRQIYSLFYQPLYNFGLSYVEKDIAENCIQDMFLYILQHRANLKNIKNVKAYLYKSFRNQLYKNAKAQKLILQALEKDFYFEKSENIFAEVITKLIKKLSNREQEIVKLKYYQNYKNKEIATALNIEYQTVRNTLHNAIQKMRILMPQVDYC